MSDSPSKSYTSGNHSNTNNTQSDSLSPDSPQSPILSLEHNQP
jgi:hypothetical protein